METSIIGAPLLFLKKSYNIIVKVMAWKPRYLFPQIVHPKQTKFIQSRFKVDNIIVVWEGIEWAPHSHQNAI